ncbi:MAG: serine hydrolase domain-containing protein [Cyclobacteriaceae bacterium]
MKKISILTLALIFTIGLKGQTLTDIRTDFAERIKKTMKKNDVVGAAVAVVSSDSVLWIDSFGYADKETQAKVTANTLFGLGSVTKVFTSIAVLQLQDRNVLDIDDPLNSHLKSFKIKGGHSDQVTPRNVLIHHSGLPSDIFKGMFTSKPENYKEVVNYIGDEYMAGVPGEIRAYSNSGYSLLGNMIYEATGTEYDEYVRESILKVLKMDNSEFNALESASRTYNRKGDHKEDLPLRDIPAGGLFSTANDMAKFASAYLSRSGQMLSLKSYEEMMTVQNGNVPLDFGGRYGLGWSMTTRPHVGDIFYHTGTTLYFNAAIALAPEADLGVVILTNSERGGRVYREVHSILEEVAKSYGKPEQPSKNVTDLGNKKRVEVEGGSLDQYSGIYATPGAYLNVFTKGKKLMLRIQGIKAELIPVGGNTFIPKPILLGVIPIKLNENRMYFESIAGHQVMTQIELNGTKELVAEKVELPVISEEWKKRLGNYQRTDLMDGELSFFIDFQLKEKDGLLIFSLKQSTNGQTLEMVLDIIDENRGKISGLGRYAGQSLQVENDQLKIFGFSLKKSEGE